MSEQFNESYANCVSINSEVEDAYCSPDNFPDPPPTDFSFKHCL